MNVEREELSESGGKATNPDIEYGDTSMAGGVQKVPRKQRPPQPGKALAIPSIRNESQHDYEEEFRQYVGNSFQKAEEARAKRRATVRERHVPVYGRDGVGNTGQPNLLGEVRSLRALQMNQSKTLNALRDWAKITIPADVAKESDVKPSSHRYTFLLTAFSAVGSIAALALVEYAKAAFEKRRKSNNTAAFNETLPSDDMDLAVLHN